MFRVYFVKETEYGLTVEGPNGHRWVCKPDDTWSRATGFAKALERAYLEGQKSVSQDVNIAISLDALAELGTDIHRLSPEDLKAKVAELAEKSANSRRKLDRIRTLNSKLQLHQLDDQEQSEPSEADAKDDTRPPSGPVVFRPRPRPNRG